MKIESLRAGRPRGVTAAKKRQMGTKPHFAGTCHHYPRCNRQPLKSAERLGHPPHPEVDRMSILKIKWLFARHCFSYTHLHSLESRKRNARIGFLKRQHIAC
jgi:hypothetical protein